MAKSSLIGTGDVEEVSNTLSNDLINNFGCELVDYISHNYGGTKIVVMVFEKYYVRSGDRVSLTACISNNNSNVIVDLIGAGAGQGIIFKFSLGAEENFVDAAESILRDKGFQ